MDIKKEFQIESQVATYDMGNGDVFRLSTILKETQEAGELHLDALHLPYEKLKEQKLVFMFARIGMKIHRLPQRGEKYELITSTRGVLGAQFFRDYRFYQNGKLIVDVLSASILVETEKHKIQRPKVFEPFGIDPGDYEKGTNIEKISLPEDLVVVGERAIRYTDLDYNGHLNNAIYADVFCDFFPGGFSGNELANFRISYLKETMENETLKIYAKKEDKTVYMYGENPRGISFECLAELK